MAEAPAPAAEEPAAAPEEAEATATEVAAAPAAAAEEPEPAATKDDGSAAEATAAPSTTEEDSTAAAAEEPTAPVASPTPEPSPVVESTVTESPTTLPSVPEEEESTSAAVSPSQPSEIAEETGPHQAPDRPESAIDQPDPPEPSPSTQAVDEQEGYASDDSFSLEVKQITHGDEAPQNSDDYFYTRSGRPVFAADVDKEPDLLNSPRFKEACKTQGIRVKEDLKRRTLDQFHEKGLSAVKQKMRCEFFEATRVKNAKIVLEERERLIRKKHREASEGVKATHRYPLF